MAKLDQSPRELLETAMTTASANAPPPTLDGARVLWWAWAGATPFGELQGEEGNDRWVYGFAVCRYESGSVYRFSCNKNWDVVQDADHDTEESAKANIPAQYDASRVQWQRLVSMSKEGQT
jgi:hypothetical protein